MPNRTQGKKHPSNLMPGAPDQFDSFWKLVDRRLTVYGNPRHGNLKNPLDELVFIVLSAQTEAYLYQETFRALYAAFRPWSHLLEATEGEVAQIIRHGGLALKKTRQLKGAFRKIIADTGLLSLNFLLALPDSEALSYLKTLPGIGIKSAACIMMYSLDRQVFPVDTHAWRISRRLGQTAPVPKPTEAQARELEGSIPLGLRYRLHVNMISHGQQICTTYSPKCNDCVLSDVCQSSGKTDAVWNQWRRPSGVWAKVAQQK
jgi:endonuclease-3